MGKDPTQLTFEDRLRACGFIPDKPAPPSPSKLKPSAALTPYLTAALAAEAGKVAGAVEGTRNHTLNTAAFSLGQLVAGAGLDRDRVVDELTAAAEQCGLRGHEVERTIRSGLDAGERLPRTVPAAAESSAPVPSGPPVTFDDEVAAEVHRLQVRQEAARQVRAAVNGVGAQPPTGLDTFLAVADDPVTYRVDQVLPIGARAILGAPAKSGKSTVIGNLLRALADGDPFLEAFPVTEPVGKIVLVDDELDRRTLRRWLRDQGITHTDRIQVASLRGRVASFDIIDPHTRAQWAALLAGADVLILDCLRPVLDALGLSEDKDAGKFLVAFDALLAQAGVGEAVVVHHHGHTAERSRGDSRLRDWPDVEWRLARQHGEDGAEADPDAPRYFTAFGRDVDVREGRLDYDPATRRVSYVGGTRRDAKTDDVLPDLLELLANNADGLSGRQITEALQHSTDHRREVIRKAVSRAVGSGQISTEAGPHRSTIHRLNASAPSAPSVCQNTGIQCASVPIRAHGALPTHDTTSEPPAHCTICGKPMGLVEAGQTTHPTCGEAA